jgi:hypothetical protein
VPLETLEFDGELLALSTATQRAAQGVSGPSISARLDEIADELLELARSDAQMWLAGKAWQRGQATA